MSLITWAKQPSLLKAIQDCGVVVADDQLITFGGYCSGPMSGAIISAAKNKKNYRRKKQKYVRGFSNAVHRLSLKKDKPDWKVCNKFPGAPRASFGVTTLDGKVYCWGGYSFKPKPVEKVPVHKRPPKDAYTAHSDGYVFDLSTGTWSKLPELPQPITNFNLVNDGHYIYLFGGATIRKNTKSPDVTQTGSQLWMIDSKNLSSGWNRLPDCLGTPRIDASFTYHQGALYLLGGIYPNPHWSYQKSGDDRFYTVRDNWKFDLKKKTWEQLTTHDFLIGNWASNNNQALDDRYILLIGGSYYHRSMLNKEESTTNPVVLTNKGHKPGEYEFIISKDIYRYDLVKNEFELVDELPFPINKPKWYLSDRKIYLCGGESVPAAGKYRPGGQKEIVEGYTFDNEFFGYHSDLCVVGMIN